MPEASARELAVRILRDIERKDGFSNRTLAEHLERHPSMAGRDRAFTTVLVYGVLRHRLRLDAHIDRAARKPAGLKGNVREVLRIATFELLELGRPAAVALSQAATQLRKLDRSGRIVGAAHAILLAVAESGESNDAAFAAQTPLLSLEQRWSIPRWMGGRWIKTLGAEQAIARARALSAPPSLDLRIDLSRTTREEVAGQLAADHPGAEIVAPTDYPGALQVQGGGDLFYGPLHDQGLISVQGLAAQQAAIVLAPVSGERVLDACAGMGIKTLQLAELMQRSGTIVSAELEPRQLAELPGLVTRGRLETESLNLQAEQVDVTAHTEALDEADPFDAVLLDVPCTGMGNLARHPEIRYLRKFEDIAARAALQRELLAACLRRVAPGGRLVYAACSFEPEEGAGVVDSVLASAPARKTFERTFTPENDGTEGFYVARIEP